MKAITSENTSTYPGIYGSTTKVTKHKREVENEEIQMYLSKLKELVPFMPRNRRLSELEVFQYVIEYICDLQHALETHPSINSAAVHSTAAAMLCSTAQANSVSSNLPTIVPPLHRQPLGVLPPNANVAVNVNAQNSCSSTESSPVSSFSSSRQSEKVSSTTTDSKSLSCCHFRTGADSYIAGATKGARRMSDAEKHGVAREIV